MLGELLSGCPQELSKRNPRDQGRDCRRACRRGRVRAGILLPCAEQPGCWDVGRDTGQRQAWGCAQFSCLQSGGPRGSD